jgi:hypothetical protein
MAQGAIVFRWGPTVRGRERQALEVFGESVGYYEDLLKNHRITAHSPFVSADHNGGMWVVQGDMMELATIREETWYLELLVRVQMTVEDFSVETYHGGTAEDLGDVLGIFGRTIEQFA